MHQTSKAAALYAKALLGGVRRALDIYRRVDSVTNRYRWVDPTTEEQRHYHAEGNLPNCRLVLTVAYHIASPALSTEEASRQPYELYAVSTKCRTSGESGDYRPSKLEVRWAKISADWREATHSQLTKSLSKHLAANKKVSFTFQQKSSMVPIMNSSPADIVDLLTFVEVTLVLFTTVTVHLPGVATAKTKVKRKKARRNHRAMPSHQDQRPKDLAADARKSAAHSLLPRMLKR